MREILFRGKRLDNGEWVYGNLNYGTIEIKSIKDSYYISDFDVTPLDKKFYFVIPKTVGQYTGLTDKNGKKIFEGDILQVKQHGKTGVRTCAIYFGEYIDADNVLEGYHCIGFYLKVDDECCSIGALLDSDFEFEIIGNIHDNPELLEVEE